MASKHQVIQLYNEHPEYSVSDIARTLDCFPGYVRATLQRNGLARRYAADTKKLKNESAEGEPIKPEVFRKLVHTYLVDLDLWFADASRREPEYRVSAMLITSILVRDEIDRACRELLGYDTEFVQQVSDRLRGCGIWFGDDIDAEELQDDKGSVISFWLYVLCGTGQLMRTADKRYYLRDRFLPAPTLPLMLPATELKPEPRRPRAHRAQLMGGTYHTPGTRRQWDACQYFLPETRAMCGAKKPLDFSPYCQKCRLRSAGRIA